MKEDIMKNQKEKPSEESRGAAVRSRRSILKGSVALLLGGVAGRMSSAYAAPAPTFAPAPPLPWPWVKLDPMEAGRRAYRNYLKEPGG
jgi:hypothetical protein